MKKALLTVCLMGFAFLAKAQLYDPSAFDKKYDGLLKHPGVQIESAEAINQMYNYKFYEADKEFRCHEYVSYSPKNSRPICWSRMSLFNFLKTICGTCNQS